MKIYISSTFDDLQGYRSAVYRQLRRLKADAIAMEDYVAGEARPLAKCLQDVAEADVYVGIFAWRYGYIPEEGNPEPRSITDLEYRAAGEHGKERLIFLLHDEASWNPRWLDSHTGEGGGGQRIKRLREELRARHVVGVYSSPDDLASQVSAAVTNYLLRRRAEVLDRAKQPREPATPALSPGISPERGHRLVLSWRAYQQGIAVARSIGRIEDATGRAVATGFLVSGSSLHLRLGSDLYLLTPAHVVVPEKSQGSFGLTVNEGVLRLTIPEAMQRVIRLREVAWFSPVDQLDLSIVRLERQPEDVVGLPIADVSSRKAFASGQLEKVLDPGASHVIVVGHPGGGQSPSVSTASCSTKTISRCNTTRRRREGAAAAPFSIATGAQSACTGFGETSRG